MPVLPRPRPTSIFSATLFGLDSFTTQAWAMEIRCSNKTWYGTTTLYDRMVARMTICQLQKRPPSEASTSKQTYKVDLNLPLGLFVSAQGAGSDPECGSFSGRLP